MEKVLKSCHINFCYLFRKYISNNSKLHYQMSARLFLNTTNNISLYLGLCQLPQINEILQITYLILWRLFNHKFVCLSDFELLLSFKWNDFQIVYFLALYKCYGNLFHFTLININTTFYFRKCHRILRVHVSTHSLWIYLEMKLLLTPKELWWVNKDLG